MFSCGLVLLVTLSINWRFSQVKRYFRWPGSAGTRTRNQRLKRALLYRLSYRPAQRLTFWCLWNFSIYNETRLTVISHKYKCIFVEVPKTGSASVRAILGRPWKPHPEFVADQKSHGELLDACGRANEPGAGSFLSRTAKAVQKQRRT